MKIAVLSIAKPAAGTGNGTTEYAFQLILRLREMGQEVDEVYAIEDSKRNDIMGLVNTQITFPRKIAKIAKMDYDIAHITIQEIGFAARILKENGFKGKVVSTVHDLTRLSNKLYQGLLQKSYNRIVAKSIEDSLKYSDYITFNSQQTMDEVFERFGPMKNARLIWHGTRRSFLNEPIQKKNDRIFRVGHVGALGDHKNVIAMLHVAEHLKGNDKIKFLIYGTGHQKENIEKYKAEKKLDNVMLMGFAPEDKLIEIYDSFDAFVLPSNYEGLSHQILEAGARELPIIVFKKARIPEAVTKHCLKAEDEKDMARIIADLQKRGFDKKEKAAATKYYREFTWDRTVKEMFELYKELMA